MDIFVSILCHSVSLGWELYSYWGTYSPSQPLGTVHPWQSTVPINISTTPVGPTVHLMTVRSYHVYRHYIDHKRVSTYMIGHFRRPVLHATGNNLNQCCCPREKSLSFRILKDQYTSPCPCLYPRTLSPCPWTTMCSPFCYRHHAWGYGE